MPGSLPLGFALGSGDAVSIPIAHMAVTGQTQQSGKTTTLEALAWRATGLTILAFVTKRGESAFADGERVQPYFRDRADWQFVTSIIDATLQEKNKFLRPWIMKICRTTHTLADVQSEVRKALKKASGINEGVYTQLDEYLNLIVPEIRRAELAPELELRPGLNVMDLSASRGPMQMLFVQSAIDWVNERERDTIVIVPEAWEFIPEGKGSPVKRSAVDLVRKGAAIGNFIWVDSQDMAGVDKEILRGCTVWLIGVQREANELKRNLANIPRSISRPSLDDVAMLERGQFYACWGKHAIKTYVQPSWLTADEARSVALGNRQGVKIRDFVDRGRRAQQAVNTILEDPPVKESEARKLQEEIDRLRARNTELQDRLDEYERGAEQSERTSTAPVASLNGDFEALYGQIKQRLVKDAPALLKVLSVKPQLDVEVKRQVVNADGTSWLGRVAALIAEGYFDEPRKSSEVFREATRRGATGVAPRADEACKKLLAMGFLTREQDGFRAVDGMKVNIVEA